MSTLIYNNIELELVKTLLFAQEAEYSPDGSEYLWTHFIIEVQAVFNPEATSYDQGPTQYPGITPTMTDVNLRFALMQPRQSLTFKVGSDVLLSSPDTPIGGGSPYPCDANNGPRPVICNIRRIDGSTTMIIHYRIETWLVECPTNDTYLLSNRWAVTDHIDENFKTTKIWRGLAQFRGDMLQAAGYNADHFRDQVLPPLLPSFQRKDITVNMASNLNAIEYQVVDVEQVVTLGDTMQQGQSGVTHFEATYITGTYQNNEAGAASPLARAQVNVKVWGNPDSANWNLFVFAVKVALQKTQLDQNLQNANGNPAVILNSVQVLEAIHDRYVELTLQCLVSPDNQQQGFSILSTVQLQMDQLKVFTNDWTSPAPPNDNNTRGTWPYEIIFQDLKDACGKQNIEYNGGQGQPGSQYLYGPTPPSVQGTLSPDLPYSKSSYSTDVYSDYRVNVSYQQDQNVLMAPIAVSGGYTSYMITAAPMTRKVVEWTAERWGSAPKIPNPNSTDTNLVLLYAPISVAAPGLMPNTSTPIYRASGTYTYGLKKPLTMGTDTMSSGLLPWTTLNFTDGDYKNWQTGIIDNGQSSSSGSSGSQGGNN